MPKRQMLHYQQVVDRFDEVARANIGQPMHIADLCRAAGVTPRTLSRAFQAVHGKPPSRYLHELRLVQVRDALLSSAGNGSVTDIAMRFGFCELGRFAVDYRARFGESPSETLGRGSYAGYTYLNPQTGHEFSAVPGAAVAADLLVDVADQADQRAGCKIQIVPWRHRRRLADHCEMNNRHRTRGCSIMVSSLTKLIQINVLAESFT